MFLHEYRVHFPVAVDQSGMPGDPLPLTMRAYGMRGTPTVILIDARGRLRQHVFGAYDDLRLGRDLGALRAEMETARQPPSAPLAAPSSPETVPGCNEGGCPLDTP